METENKSRILSNILKTPLLRNFLITSLVVSAIFPFYSVFYIIRQSGPAIPAEPVASVRQ